MSKRIGDIIIKLRDETGYSQEQLCAGLCLGSTMARIEANSLTPEHFLLDRLFGRLGKSTERLEYILPAEVYELYELRYRIQAAIVYQNFEEAEELLQEYEKKKQAKKELHRQFIEQERAQIAWMRSENTETVLEYLNCSIGQTMPLERKPGKKTALSVEELKLLLFRWEVCQGTELERLPEELEEIWDYIETKSFDAEEKAKIYPYIVFLLVENFEKHMGKNYFIKILDEALELLREEGAILYMPEILEAYASMLEDDVENAVRVKELREMKDALLSLEEEYGVHFEKYRLFHQMKRTFELDYEVIRRSRLACGMSQEELCAGICSVETLSRIERGRCHPTNKNLKGLLEKMDRKGERIGMFVMAERYETIALERRMARAVHRKEFEKVDELLEETERTLDTSSIENKQYIRSEQIRNEMDKGTLTCQEGIEYLYKSLQMTFKGNEENIFDYRLTHREQNMLNQIACLLCKKGEVENAIEIWRKIIKNYEKSKVHVAFKILNWELMTGNLAGRLEELEYVEEPMEICKKRLKIALETGKGNDIGRTLAIMACVLERKHDTACVTRFQQALNIYKLMKMKYRYKCTKEYVEEKGIQLEGV